MLRQVALIAYDYSGYGMSTGSANDSGRPKPCSARTYCDAEAVFNYYETKGKTAHVIVYGQSLG